MAAYTTSHVFGPNIVSALKNDIALDLDSAVAGTFKYTLWTNTMSPQTPSSDTGDYGNVATVWKATSGHEVDASGTNPDDYDLGGWSLTTPAFVVDTTAPGARMLWRDSGATGKTLLGYTGTPYAGMAYWDSTPNYGIVYHYFGAVPVVGGTLQLTYNNTYLSGTLFYIPFTTA